MFPETFSNFNCKTVFALALFMLLRVLYLGTLALLESASHALEEGQGPVD